MKATHQVFNQVPAFENINLYSTDTFLQDIIALQHADWASKKLKDYGELLSQPEWIEKGHLANKHTPIFHSHDRFGNRIDFIEFHPAYHEIMEAGFKHQLHSLPWIESKKGAHIARLGLNYLHAQNEAGTNCPITMTFSCVPALKKYLPNADKWLQQILSPDYDKRNTPHQNKSGLSIGMAMTEKQGGTDVRANTTTAIAENKTGAGEAYRITGHKWFCSAPMCDAFLTLAKTEKGLSCFLMPRWQPDGSKNTWEIQRLKDKLGNKSNASSEIEMKNALGWLVGEEGRGVPTIIEMVAMTRYDCMIGSSGLMRRALSEAIFHCQNRSVMGKTLINQPLMQNVLSDLAIESESALALSAVASACIESGRKEDNLLLRLLLPIGKFWITKRAEPMIGEGMECLGGNGYVEQHILPRLYREAPVNAIWEGSGNIQCLDVLRAISKDVASLDILVMWLNEKRGLNKQYDQYLTHVENNLHNWTQNQTQARILTESLAKISQARALAEWKNDIVYEAFCEVRLGNNMLQFGNVDEHFHGDILQRYQF